EDERAQCGRDDEAPQPRRRGGRECGAHGSEDGAARAACEPSAARTTAIPARTASAPAVALAPALLRSAPTRATPTPVPWMPRPRRAMMARRDTPLQPHAEPTMNPSRLAAPLIAVPSFVAVVAGMLGMVRTPHAAELAHAV